MRRRYAFLTGLCVAATLAGASTLPATSAAANDDRGDGRAQSSYGAPDRYAGAERDRTSSFEEGYRRGREDERRRSRMSSRSDRGDEDRSVGADFDRGYSMGRGDERRRVGASDRYEREDAQAQESGRTSTGPAVAVLLVERDRQKAALTQVRRSLREARTALTAGDQGRAQQALSQADQTVQRAVDSAQSWQRVEQSLQRADQALGQNDRNGAQQAIRQARQELASGQQTGGSAGDQTEGSSSSTTAGSTGPSR